MHRGHGHVAFGGVRAHGNQFPGVLQCPRVVPGGQMDLHELRYDVSPLGVLIQLALELVYRLVIIAHRPVYVPDERQGLFGFDLFDLLEGRQGVLVLLLARVDPALKLKGAQVLRVLPYCLVQDADGLFYFLVLEVMLGQGKVRCRRPGLLGLHEVRHCLIALALDLMEVSDVQHGPGVLRVFLEHLAVLGYRLVELTPGRVVYCQVVIGSQVVRVGRLRLF